MGFIRDFITEIYTTWRPGSADPDPYQGIGYSFDSASTMFGQGVYGDTALHGSMSNQLPIGLAQRASSNWWDPDPNQFGPPHIRTSRYNEADYLDTIPEVHAALDTYADEATAMDEDGNCMRIDCANAHVKRECLAALERWELNDKLWPAYRKLCKYGDEMWELVTDPQDPQRGVLAIKQLAARSMWRVITVRGGTLEYQQGMMSPDLDEIAKDYGGKGSKMQPSSMVSKNGNLRFTRDSVVHIRIGSSPGDEFYPYGMGILVTARRPAHQLKLMEDAMIVYRLTRAPERRVFYVDVGNTPPNKVEAFLQQFKDKFKKRVVMNPLTGSADQRYNPLPIRRDTPVPLLDGRTLTIEEIAREFEAGKENWVYSVQDGTRGRIVPGKIAWAGKNYTCRNIHRVWTDDGGYVDVAPEHPFVLRDGTGRRADELKPGDSLMPLYTKISDKNDGMAIEGYPMFLDNASGTWEFLHRRVANDALAEERELVRGKIDWSINNNLVVHHKNFNSNDATPSNLQWMGNADHYRYHASVGREHRIAYNKSPEKRAKTADDNRKYDKARRMGAAYNGTELHKKHNENRRLGQQASWSKDRQARSEAMQWIIPNEVVEQVFALIKANPRISKYRLNELVRGDERIMTMIREANAGVNQRDPNKFYFGAIANKLQRMGCIPDNNYSTLRDFALHNEAPKNHQVTKVEIIPDVDDVYCMTIVGPNGEDDRHNFAVQSPINPNCKIFVLNSVDEDFFIPTRGNQSGSRIDTLQGAQNLSEVDDAAYFRRRLFVALKIPPNWLETDIASGGGRVTLSSQDVRFAKTIFRIQREMAKGVKEALIRHLTLIGVPRDQFADLRVTAVPSSPFFEITQAEVIDARLTRAANALQSGIYSLYDVYTMILKHPHEMALELQRRMRQSQIDKVRLDAYASGLAMSVQMSMNNPPQGARPGAPRQVSTSTEPVQDALAGEEERIDATAPASAEGEGPASGTNGETDSTPPPAEPTAHAPGQPTYTSVFDFGANAES